ncbi:class I SAM-dependent methyltransferase [Kamptonema cortianum]|nr:class I SAM-dependent methyltransferase [Oscillatoria laete-virens]MDK3159966.1 class I SAM-dependent methyltransferase [Kamptonema cortianum]MDL5047193.1 class I SAM-dependent methyltransferase [Oscillatoria amoena NRMC-F 0135]MDL5055475.1 class I SAM-dependent methyltransferase [Oscillatoria laete-virens NRMC-F 0139]
MSTNIRCCPVCNGTFEESGKVVVRGKYNVSVVTCLKCGFTTFPHVCWLDEAYANAITPSDIGYVNRNISWSGIVSRLYVYHELPIANYVDYGSGYGMFVRLMRDNGYHFHSYEPYCKNLFAQYTTASTERFGNYECLTAFEVFEHLSDINESFQEMLGFSDCILFSTDLISTPIPSFDSWSYYGFEHGQHISFWTQEALGIMAIRHGLKYTQLNWISPSWHLIAPKDHPLHHPIKRPSFYERVLRRLGRKKNIPESLLLKDAAKIVEREKCFYSGMVVPDRWHLDDDFSQAKKQT